MIEHAGLRSVPPDARADAPLAPHLSKRLY